MSDKIQTPTAATPDKFSESFPRQIAVLGNNTCAWMAAAMLARNMQGLNTQITVLSGDHDQRTPFRAISTSPTLTALISSLGVDEQDMLRSCQGTYRLANRFSNWTSGTSHFVHPVSDDGKRPGIRSLYDNWQIKRAGEAESIPLDRFVVQGLAASTGRSPHSFSGTSPLSDPAQYGYHVDSQKLSDWFRTVALDSNVCETADKVVETSQNPDGRTTAVRIASGQTIPVDFVIDCRQVTQKSQKTAANWTDLSTKFQCDRIVRQAFKGQRQVPSHTGVYGMEHGWAAVVPLHNELEWQYAYSRSNLSDESALQQLRDLTSKSMDAELAESGSPIFSDLYHGRCSKFWRNNVVRMGPAAFEIEPLSASSIHLSVVQIEVLLELLGDRLSDSVNRIEYNRRVGSIVDETFDFAQLHHVLRDPAAQNGPSKSLKELLAIYDANGSIRLRNADSPSRLQWALLLTGAGRMPRNSAWEMRQANEADVERHMQSVLAFNEATVRDLPRHEEILDWIHSAPLPLEAG